MLNIPVKFHFWLGESKLPLAEGSGGGRTIQNRYTPFLLAVGACTALESASNVAGNGFARFAVASQFKF